MYMLFITLLEQKDLIYKFLLIVGDVDMGLGDWLNTEVYYYVIAADFHASFCTVV